MDGVRRSSWASNCPCCLHDGERSRITWRSFAALSILIGCNKNQHWHSTCGQHPRANKNQQRKILPISQPRADSITMTAITVREATGIKATVQIPGCRKLMFSCSCRQFGNTRLHLQPLKSRHLQEKYKNDKAVPRLYLNRTS